MSAAWTSPAARLPDQTGWPVPPRRRWPLWGGLAAVAVITVWAGYGIGFTLSPLFTDLGRGSEILRRLADPNWSFAWRVRDAWLQTLYIAVLAAAIGNGVALLASMLVSKVTSPNHAVYHGCRQLLNVVRSLPDVAYALLFVAAVGTGALGGLLALVMFNLGVNAKLTSETIDGVDRGPLEAADAAGANRIQRAWTAVVPQILPNYTSYSLYVFELNLRASLVIGLAGGGGIGQVLSVQLSRFAYENIGAVIVVFFVVVFTLDRASIWLRRRLV